MEAQGFLCNGDFAPFGFTTKPSSPPTTLPSMFYPPDVCSNPDPPRLLLSSYPEKTVHRTRLSGVCSASLGLAVAGWAFDRKLEGPGVLAAESIHIQVLQGNMTSLHGFSDAGLFNIECFG